jgi:hypothetical protein
MRSPTRGANSIATQIAVASQIVTRTSACPFTALV